MNLENEFEYRIKIIIAGSIASGKSSILRALCNESFMTEYSSTIGVDYGTVTLKNENIQYKFCLWDTSGNKIFMPITKSYFNSSIACILVFDLTSKKSFTETIEWYHHYNNICPGNIIILVGNKLDKIKNKNEDNTSLTYGTITEPIIRNFIDTYSIPYIETSALTKQNITELKNLILSDINAKILSGNLKPNTTIGLTLHKIDNGSTLPYKYESNPQKTKDGLACCSII